MMTIKEFASLCGCNAQTLRYYDKIDLLKPVQVDQWSGYRYYEKIQAVDFVKIKNLQAADFSIGEIKALLTMSDSRVYEAFERKIAEQEQKLVRIKEIQKSYLTEVNTMKKMIESFCDHLLKRATDQRILREFDLSAEGASGLVKELQQLLILRTVESGEKAHQVTMIVDDACFEGTEAVEKLTFIVQEDKTEDTVYLNAENVVRNVSELTVGAETVWELHGWSYTHEFLDHIPIPQDGSEYMILVLHHDQAICERLSYPLILIGALLMRGHGSVVNMNCFVDYSKDGQNHVALMRRK